jgi:hypothetical protein
VLTERLGKWLQPTQHRFESGTHLNKLPRFGGVVCFVYRVWYNEAMSNFLDRFIYVDKTKGEKQNPLLWPFLLITTAYSFAFTFFIGSKAVTETILFQQTALQLGSNFLSVWGVIGLLIVIGTFVGIYVRKAWLGTTVSYAGFLLWLYTAFIYAMGGFWLQVFAISIPNMVFWLWWNRLINWYHRKYGG